MTCLASLVSACPPDTTSTHATFARLLTKRYSVALGVGAAGYLMGDEEPNWR